MMPNFPSADYATGAGFGMQDMMPPDKEIKKKKKKKSKGKGKKTKKQQKKSKQAKRATNQKKQQRQQIADLMSQGMPMM